MHIFFGFLLIFFTDVKTYAASSEGYLVKFKDVTQNLNTYGLQINRVMSPHKVADGLGLKIQRKIPFSEIYKVSTDKSIGILRNHPQVAWIEPNYIYKITGHKVSSLPQSTSEFDRSWWHMNTGQTDILGQTGVINSDIKSVSLWNRGYFGSKNVKVAILDSGVDYQHKNLRNNIYLNKGEIPDNKIDDDKNGFVDDVYGWNFIDKNNNPMDKLGHGTHVAGIVGANGENNRGVVGVSPQVSIIPIKVMDDEGYGTLENILEGIYYAKNRGANIINASLGGDPYSQAFFEALKDLDNEKILFVTAAGNDNMNNDDIPFYPASYELSNIIAVAANDNRDLKADFSHYGAKSVHISAPGVLITSTTPGDNFNYFSGTSMSSPFVAGGAALLMSIFPEESIYKIKERLLISCDPAYPLKRQTLCHGRLNLENAFLNKKSDQSDPDESLWKKIEYHIETPHPYVDGQELNWIVSYPGAKYLRIHFQKIETEEFDRISIYMSNGKMIELLSGEKQNYTSEPILGSELRLKFKPDLSLSKFGFVISYIEVIL